MHERGRRASDRNAPLQRRWDDVDQTVSEREPVQATLAIFAEPPFLVWRHRQHKYRQVQQLHPSAMPLILLWDEGNETPLASNVPGPSTKRDKGLGSHDHRN